MFYVQCSKRWLANGKGKLAPGFHHVCRLCKRALLWRAGLEGALISKPIYWEESGGGLVWMWTKTTLLPCVGKLRQHTRAHSSWRVLGTNQVSRWSFWNIYGSSDTKTYKDFPVTTGPHGSLFIFPQNWHSNWFHFMLSKLPFICLFIYLERA